MIHKLMAFSYLNSCLMRHLCWNNEHNCWFSWKPRVCLSFCTCKEKDYWWFNWKFCWNSKCLQSCVLLILLMTTLVSFKITIWIINFRVSWITACLFFCWRCLHNVPQGFLLIKIYSDIVSHYVILNTYLNSNFYFCDWIIEYFCSEGFSGSSSTQSRLILERKLDFCFPLF